MKTFLQLVAEETIQLQPLETLVIFPTQRACVEYKTCLAKLHGKASVLPSISPISDILPKINERRVADDFTLLLELYATYTELFGAQTFSIFISFGQQVLDAFNEVDRQLINARQLFEQINDLKVLEDRFSPGEEEYNWIRQFWENFFTSDLTPLQDSFLQYWGQLAPLYDAFKSRLIEKGFAYEGMAWREALQPAGNLPFFSQFSNVVFAGFYALNKTEELLLDQLKDRCQLLLFRDADILYTENKLHEAGRYFKKGWLSGAEVSWTSDHFSNPKVSVSARGSHGRFACAQSLSNDIQKITENRKGEDLSAEMVIVLTDEDLLFPLLQAAAGSGIELNPSMGFPMSHHPLMRLLEVIRSSRNVFKDEVNEVSLLRLLEEFCCEPILQDIFQKSELGKRGWNETPAGIYDYAPEIVSLLAQQPAHPSSDARLLTSFVNKFKFSDNDWLARLHQHLIIAIKGGIEMLNPYQDQLQASDWWQLLMQHLSSQRIPFQSDKKGIPVMGFLETRLLDFKRVFIATLNEGTLPSDSTPGSLIPTSIRKAYHLPCREEQQAVTAYHFYRLLQRSEHLHFYYNTDLNATGGGEKSRYLFQLHLEVFRKYPPLKLDYSQSSSVLLLTENTDIRIDKSAEIIEQLERKFVDNDENRDKFKGLSATAINTYIACSLRFYFDQVVYLKPESNKSGLSAGHFGNVLHKAMELAYPVEQNIDTKLILDAKQKATQLVEEAIKIAYGKPVDTGHDFLMKGVLTELIRRLLQFDAENAPFRIIGIEKKFQSSLKLNNGKSILIKGIIDRIDVFNGEIRILDYKTGRDSIEKTTNHEKLFSNTKQKLNLQLLLYALLTNENLQGQSKEAMKAGIFRMREFDNSITWLNEGNALNTEELKMFREGLSQLIGEIFNREVPFVKTEKLDNCKYCDYAGLCNRKSV